MGGKKCWRGMPNNAFDRVDLCDRTHRRRIASVVARAQSFPIGVGIGWRVQCGLNNLLVNSHKKKKEKMETGRASAGREDVRVGYERSSVCRATPDINRLAECADHDDGSLDELGICNHRHGVDSFNQQPSW